MMYNYYCEGIKGCIKKELNAGVVVYLHRRHPSTPSRVLPLLLYISRMIMDKGWISLHRKMINWEWYTCSNTFRIFLHLLLKANHKNCKWKGIEILRGQVIIGRKKISSELNISEQSVRTSLKKLKSTRELTIKTTNQYSIITLNNYSNYQSTNQQANQQLTNDQPATNQRLTTNNNVNNYNNVIKKLESIKIHKSVKNEIEKLIKVYGIDNFIEMIDRFDIYQKEFVSRGWDLQYRLKKRWNKFYENIEIYETVESLNQEFETIAKRNRKKSSDLIVCEPQETTPPTKEEKIKYMEGKIYDKKEYIKLLDVDHKDYELEQQKLANMEENLKEAMGIDTPGHLKPG